MEKCKKEYKHEKKILTGLINLIANLSFIKYKDTKKQKAAF